MRTVGVERGDLQTRRPSVSVVIPTQDRADFFAEALQSVLDQTHPTGEIIVVDNGSTAEHLRCKRRVADRSEIVQFHELGANRGASFARNYGLERAVGDYILFLDDDDTLHPNMLASSLSLFSAETDLVICASEFFYTSADSTRRHKVVFLLNEGNRRNGWLNSCLEATTSSEARQLERAPLSTLLMTCPPINACLVRRRSIGDTRFPEDLDLGEEWYFWLRLASEGCQYRCNPECGACIRIHDGNRARRDRRHSRDILTFHHKVRQSGMLKTRRDLFLNQAHLLLNQVRYGRPPALGALGRILMHPGMLLKYGLVGLAR